MNSSYEEEDEEEEEVESFQSEASLRLEHHVVDDQESENDDEETQETEEEKKLREKREFKKKCHDMYVLSKEWLGKVVKHWGPSFLITWCLVYRGILTILVAIDILWSLFYILDYNNYVIT